MARRWLIALGLVTAIPAPATAAPPWTPPISLATNVAALQGGGASIAPLADGEVVVAYQEEATPGSGVFLATVTTSGVGVPIPLDPLGRSPRVASDPAGAAVIVWIRPDGLYAVLRGADGTLTAPRRILDVAADQEVRRFDLATAGRTVGGGLRAVVVALVDNNALYAQDTSSGSVVATRLDSGAWAGPITLASGLRNPLDVDVAAAASGAAAAAWGDTADGVAGTVVVARMTSTGTWRDIARVGGRTARDIEVTLDETGGSTVAWVQRGPGPNRLLTRTRPPIGRYGDAVQVATGQIEQVSLGSDAAGNVTMAWVKRTDTQSRLQTATRPAAGVWSSVGVLAVTSQTIPSVALTVNQRGDALAAWTMVDGVATANHYARYRRAGSVFGVREKTADTGDGRNTGAPVVSLAATAEGGAVLQVGTGDCCAQIAATVRTTAAIPLVSQLRLSANRLVGRRVVQVRFVLSRAGRVMVALRTDPRRPAALVIPVTGRAGLNVVNLDGGKVQLLPGNYTVSVGPTAHASDPGAVVRTLRRVR
jgi:hypothetical protein